jgi:arginyl-tRNA--protein-N-Asp/Glu arginylyltransferase
MVKQAADQIQTKLRDHSEKYATARAYVEQLHKSGELSEAQVCKFAELRKFDETAAAMSLLMEPANWSSRACIGARYRRSNSGIG